MSVLEVKNINKSYKEKLILKDFSLNVDRGKIVSILGPSGIGKSTLLRCINGLEKIDSGKIVIDNKIIRNNMLKDSNLKVGLIFQEYNLFPQYSVIKNITLPLIKVLKFTKQDAIQLAKKILIELKLEDKQNSFPYELSGGEKQRVAIARALAIDYEIICFDEPTSALDQKLVNQVIKIIKQLALKEKAILIVTHDVNFAQRVSDKIVEIKK